MNTTNAYEADQIQALSGLSHVRARPLMYLGSAGVGVAGLELCGDSALLRSVAVADGWRSRGVGRALVHRVIADAESRGLHALYLLTTTAEHYFPSFGFVPIERASAPAAIQQTGEFRGACPDSAVALARHLPAADSRA